MISKILKSIANTKYDNDFDKYMFIKSIFWRFNFGRKKDDFHWDYYTYHYKDELDVIGKTNTVYLKEGDYVYNNRELKLANKSIKPLHNNWRLLYETIKQLEPLSVIELGCGNGMHLHNINMLNKKIHLYGLDRSIEQLKFSKEVLPNLNATLNVKDATKLFNKDSFKMDVCYSQAVIMHIKKGNKHINAMINMFNSAHKHVIMVENWESHNFFDDIMYIKNKNLTNWDTINIYFRKDNNGASLIVCSKNELDYEELKDYNQLTK